MAVVRGLREADSVASADQVLLAHLTDVHVVGDGCDDELHVDNNSRLAAAVDSIVAEAPAVHAVLATGDLTAWGRAADYTKLAELLAPIQCPVLPLPGNHDDRDGMRATFPDIPWADAEHASWVRTVGGVRIVALDSTRPGEPGAEFDAEREEWLRGVLGEPHHGPTLLALHHPPFRTGVEWMDRSGFIGLHRFTEVVAEHLPVRIVCGHLHRPITTTVGGVPTHVGLSTIEAVHLDLADNPRPRLILDPVGYNVVTINGPTVVTHTRFVDPAVSAFEPTWADLYA
jgi:3',5'-cyclic AMP phosphodiesterase CpdA